MRKYLLTGLFLLTLGWASAQTMVKGTVTDESGSPMPGVNVSIKGTTEGTATDIDGNYTLSVNDGDVLRFSFIGYKTQEINVNGQTTINVQLQPDVSALDEVVVVGYGTSTKKELTGSVSVMTDDKIANATPQRIDQALQGQVAGVGISAASGSPGGALNIRIRGLSTFNENKPLILVDGIQYDAAGLNALNPDDIESINILKDATAAIYGVRAANGVILIKTKQGSLNTKPKLELSGYYGIQETSNKIDVLNAHQFAVLKNETFAAGGQTPPYNNTALGVGTDWQDLVFQQAPVQSYNLNVTGGGETSSYSIGASYLDQEGIVGGDKSSFTRYNGRINFTNQILPSLKLTNVLLYSNETRKTLPENGIGSVLYNAINANPIDTAYTPNGDYSYLEDVAEIINPLAQIHNTYNRAKTNKIVGKEELSYDINDDFTVTARGGYNYSLVDYKSFSPLVWYGNGKAPNTAADEDLNPVMVDLTKDFSIPRYSSVTQSRTSNIDYTFEAFLNYEHTFGAHKIKGTLGTSYVGNNGYNLSGTAYNVPYNSWEYADISATDGADLLNNTSGYHYRSRLLSYFIRAEYSYDRKYFASVIARRDASSNFGKNNRFGYFPSVSLAWVASEEPFFDFGFVNFAKLRASYGVIGNDQIGQFRYRALLNGEGVYVFNDQLVSGKAIGTLGNPDLKWETTEQADIGIDLGLFNDLLDVTADFYRKSTHGLLIQPPVSGVIGAYGAGSNPPYINSGDVRNQGFELKLDYSQEIAKDVKLSFGYNLTTIQNKVTVLPQGVPYIQGAPFGIGGAIATRMEVGYPIGYFFGYKTDGVFQSDEEVANSAVVQEGAHAGDLRYKDLNGDGKISFGDNSDKTMLGSPIPDFTMGLNIGLNVKGFDLSANFYASLGNQILRNYERQQPLANLLSYNLNRWTGPGSTNQYPRLTTGMNNNTVMSDFFVEDGSFLRLKNLQIGYTLPKKVSDYIKVRSFRAYIGVKNLFTLTKYKGYDPDIAYGSPLASGIDYGFYPQPRTYMAGFNLKF